MHEPTRRSRSDAGTVEVRVASVVDDPTGGAAILALTPANRCAAALSLRPSATWTTLAVHVRRDAAGPARLDWLRDAPVVMLRRTARGVELEREGLQMRLRLARVPGHDVIG